MKSQWVLFFLWFGFSFWWSVFVWLVWFFGLGAGRKGVGREGQNVQNINPVVSHIFK